MNRIIKIYMNLAWLILPFISFAQELHPEVSVDTAQIRIGEQFLYSIGVDKTAKEVIFPEQLELFNLEVVLGLPMDTLKGRVYKRYVLTGFDSGAFYIPKQQLLVNNRRIVTDSILINVATVKVDTVENPLYGIKAVAAEPYIFDDFKPVLGWIALVVLIVMLGYFAYRFFVDTRVKQEAIKPAIPPYQLAKQRLEALDKETFIQEGRVKEYYVELTDILRTYIEEQCLLPAKESTTDELLDFLKDFKMIRSAELSTEWLLKLKGLLQEADLVKFAKLSPEASRLDQDKNLTVYLVDELKKTQDALKQKELEQAQAAKQEKAEKGKEDQDV
ncbi:MAG: hypothetical protein ACPGRE_00865 [Flavobacteriaceae bacterium]